MHAVLDDPISLSLSLSLLPSREKKGLWYAGTARLTLAEKLLQFHARGADQLERDA